MKPTLLLLTAILFSACAPAPVPATATSTLTLTPTRTPTLTPTATITPTPVPSLPADFPPEFQAQIGGADFEIRGDHVWVTTADGTQQDWFEQTPEKNWQTTDWKILEDAAMPYSWQPEKNWKNTENTIGAYSWPIFTGEAAVEKQMILGGQEMTVLVLPAIIRDMQDQNIIRHVFIPLRYTDKNGQVLLETSFITGTSENAVEKTIADLLQNLQRGQQLELQMNIFYKNGKGFCGNGNLRCGIKADLIEAQALDLVNKNLRDGDILPVMTIADFIKGGEYLLHQ